MNADDRVALYRWLAEGGLAATSADALLAGFCERLVAGGVPLLRGLVTLESLEPTVEAVSFIWRRTASEAWREAHPRFEDRSFEPEGWLRSPLYALHHSDDTVLRRRLDQAGAADEFPIFPELIALGATDYLATKVAFGGVGAGVGILASWTTDRIGGFTDSDLEILHDLLPGLYQAVETVTLSESAAVVLGAYLGRNTADLILGGSVGRGVAHTLDAVLWASDLAGFTRLADTEPREQVIDLLNAYAERAVDAVEAEGGQVLKFTGDGMLAVFDRASLENAPSRALAAATRALAETRAVSQERADARLPVSQLRVALHCGEVFYGNVGSRSRLDFTVVGPAVNEAARLCDMCKSVDRDLVVSTAFRAAAPALRERFVALGRFALRGVSRPEFLYMVDEPT